MQVTAGSVLGAFGPAANELAHRMLKEGLVSFFASDAHGTTWRKPLMAGAFETVAGLIGNELAELMFIKRPAMILANAEPALLTGSGRRVGPRRRVTSDGFAWRVVHRILGSGS